ncbi:MAG: glycosyltransferase [Spirochaetes bacterium]|nr:MAG: glycosyltransferase [Spirochaetota bacterium]
MEKILFVLPSLCGGGAEKVVLNLLNYLNREKFVLHLALFEYKGVYLVDLPEDIVVYNLNKKNKFDFLKLVFSLAYKVFPDVKPDVVISFLWYTNLVVILAKLLSYIKPKVIINERISINSALKTQKFWRIKKFLIRSLYRYADRIIAVSKGSAQKLIDLLGLLCNKIKVIYNGVSYPIEQNVGSAENPVLRNIGGFPIIVSCGRLIWQKNQELLIKAAYIVLEQMDIKVLILGEGPEEANLRKLVRQLGIEDKVLFLGFQKDIYKYIKIADVFVLSSRYEGFPNVILEAMACGVPVISTDCPDGPNEIIVNGVNGMLVPPDDVNAMAQAIVRLLNNDKLKEKFRIEGWKRIRHFGIDKMVAEYEEVFNMIST